MHLAILLGCVGKKFVRGRKLKEIKLKRKKVNYMDLVFVHLTYIYINPIPKIFSS